MLGAKKHTTRANSTSNFRSAGRLYALRRTRESTRVVPGPGRVKNHGDNGRVGQALHTLSLRAAEAACGKSRPVVRVLFVDPGGIAGFTLTKVPNESRVVMRTGLRPLSHRHQAQCLLSAQTGEVTDSTCEAFAACFEGFGQPEPSGNERCGRACAEGISASRSNVKPGEMNPG